MTITKILLPLFTSSLLIASPGASTYNQACKGCHGANGKNTAMGKSKPIKGMSVSSLNQTMEDYASGKRKSMQMIKTIKKNFIKKHSKDEIQAVYTYIQGL